MDHFTMLFSRMFVNDDLILYEKVGNIVIEVHILRNCIYSDELLSAANRKAVIFRRAVYNGLLNLFFNLRLIVDVVQ
jgi:hypothetical protein